jgi:hypothetical protein
VNTLTALKEWAPFYIVPLLGVGAFFLGGAVIVYTPANQRAVAVVAICRDGSRIYQHADGSHYIRVDFHRIPVPNPETVCR